MSDKPHANSASPESLFPSPKGRGARGEVARGEVPITRNQPVAPEKLGLAKQLRKVMTPVESVLWNSLRNNALAGLHFRRQQVVAGFIVDFYCASARLAVEVDGAVHLEQQGYDADRDRALSQLGIRTIRFRNEAITRNIGGVLRQIAQQAATSPSSHRLSERPGKNRLAVPLSRRERGKG